MLDKVGNQNVGFLKTRLKCHLFVCHAAAHECVILFYRNVLTLKPPSVFSVCVLITIHHDKVTLHFNSFKEIW